MYDQCATIQYYDLLSIYTVVVTKADGRQKGCRVCGRRLETRRT